MAINLLLDIFKKNLSKTAIIWRNRTFSYEWLLQRYEYWHEWTEEHQIKSGKVIILEADFSPNSIALMLALITNSCIIVPITTSVSLKKNDFIKIAEGEILININKLDQTTVTKLSYTPKNDLYTKLRLVNHPGLVLFSSGSTGESKGVVHDFTRILNKFKKPRHSLRTITFLLYDHIGGINTLFYILSSAGTIVTIQERSPDAVLKAVEKYRVELLPISPTFINLILLSEAYKRYDLSSLQIVTYGTEPMLQSTLERFNKLFPNISLQQTYGLSEVGILRSKSKSSDSLWVKIGGEDFETRVVNDILHIKAKSSMLGYLNAPSPFTEDGWFITDDLVEADGDYIRFLGRTSEIINVAGEKVYPTEVESVIQELDNVSEVTVHGEKNPITGNIVCVKVTLKVPEDRKQFIKRLKHHCKKKLQNYKVPVKIKITEEKHHSNRFKKIKC